VSSNRKARRLTSEPFVMLEYRVLDCPAYRKLKPSSKIVYHQLRRFAGIGTHLENVNQPFKSSYTILKKHTGFALSTIAAALRQLENIGFLNRIDRGGKSAQGNHCGVWKLSDRFLKFGCSDELPGKLRKEKHPGCFGHKTEEKNKAEKQLKLVKASS